MPGVNAQGFRARFTVKVIVAWDRPFCGMIQLRNTCD